MLKEYTGTGGSAHFISERKEARDVIDAQVDANGIMLMGQV